MFILIGVYADFISLTHNSNTVTADFFYLMVINACKSKQRTCVVMQSLKKSSSFPHSCSNPQHTYTHTLSSISHSNSIAGPDAPSPPDHKRRWGGVSADLVKTSCSALSFHRPIYAKETCTSPRLSSMRRKS